MDDRRVDDRAGGDFQSFRLQMTMHLLEERTTEVMGFEQMAEAADRGLIRHRFAAEINAGELAHRQRDRA